MSLVKFAAFDVLASAVAGDEGALPADVLRVGGSGQAFYKSAHRHEFAYDPKPGYLYVRSRAISSRTNDNFDTFPAHAIKQAWRTFVGKPVFVNHHNANHRRARGVIVDAALHEDVAPDGGPDTWVEVLMEVDAVRFPKLAEAVVKGHIDRTSMGTEVALSTCSYCGNQAANPAEYCRHIPAMKGQRITRTTAHGAKESVLVSEICEGLHFFENSLLVEPPADPTAFTFGLDTRGLAAEQATAHLARTASSNVKAAALRAVLAEQEAAMPQGFTDFEIIEAEAILATANIMCSECNPLLKGATNQLCSPHSYYAKQRAEGLGSQGDMPSHNSPQMTGARKTALGEQKAPADVDTLRIEACPVCKDDESFNGTQCMVCGFVKPPDLFDDPDTSKAKQVDLRGGDTGENTGTKQELQCPNCQATFPLPDKAKAETSAPGQRPGFTSTSAAPPPFEKKDDAKAPADAAPQPEQEQKPEANLAAGDTCPTCQQGTLQEITVPADPAAAAQEPQGDPEAQIPGEVQPDQAQVPGDPQVPGPAVDPKADPNAVTDPAANPVKDPRAPHDPKAPNGMVPPEGDPHAPKSDQPDVQPEVGQQGVQPGDAEDAQAGIEPGAAPPHQHPSENPAHPDHHAPPTAQDPGQGGDQPHTDDASDQSKDPKDGEGDDDDEDKKKSKPPFFQKKQSKETVDMANPAQERRNALVEALMGQQARIEAQDRKIASLTRAMTTMAKAAGVSAHPHFASLVTAADEENKPVATTDEQALKPDAKDDPESVGAVPSSANEGVTPAATTDVQSTDVSLTAEPLNNLTDVTAPTSGTDVPKGDAAHVETDVKVSAPSNEPFPDNSGWKSAAAEDPQVRLMASIRLAQHRVAMGLAEGDHLSLAQQISDDRNLSLATIQHEVDTLAAVASRQQAPAQQARQASRGLVPQRAQEVPRTMPSLQSQGSNGNAGVTPVGQSAGNVNLGDSLM